MTAIAPLTILRRKAASGLFRARWALGLGRYPDFLVIGAQKAGTTSLFHYLAQHPQISPSRTKEPQYFDSQYFRGAKWYRAHFRKRGDERLCFEASPHSLFHPLAPGRVAAAVPNAKLIALLRNPTDRAHSHYQFNIALGVETLSFAEALAAEPERIAGRFKRLASGSIEESLELRDFSYVMRGRYAEQIERWRAHFPAERFLLLRSEDLFADPQSTLARIHEFLDLEPVPARDLAPRNRLRYPPMDSGLRRELDAAFASHNERLAAMTGIAWA